MSRHSSILRHSFSGNVKKCPYQCLSAQPKPLKVQNGFTLIELMIIVMIIGILAAVAIPSYRRYLIVNAERETQVKMMQLQIQLERWRSSALTYKGFKPQMVSSDKTVTYGYDDTDNKTIYVPNGSTATNYRYQITLVDGTVTTKSLVSGAGVDNVTGRTWKMLAIPNSSGMTKNAHEIMMSSSGTRCQSKNQNLTIASTDCGMGQEIW